VIKFFISVTQASFSMSSLTTKEDVHFVVDDSFHAYLGLSSDSHLYSVERLPNDD